MYRKYYSEYEKRAEEMHRGVPETGKAADKNLPSAPEEAKSAPPLPFSFMNFKSDDILLLALIFFLMREKNTDKAIILALAYIFISGF